jgi:hypothetical protein
MTCTPKTNCAEGLSWGRSSGEEGISPTLHIEDRGTQIVDSAIKVQRTVGAGLLKNRLSVLPGV